MKKLFGYARVSTKKQDRGVSLEEQQAHITNFVERTDDLVCEWFVEKQTASKKGRPVFNDMVKKLRAGKADGIIIHKVDRSSRNWSDWATLIELSDQGFDVWFALEQINLRSNNGRLMADIYQVFAGSFIRNHREAVQRGQTGRLKTGMYPFYTPLGYVNGGPRSGKPKQLHRTKAPMVLRLFELYATGEYSYRMLLTAAHQMGLTSHNEKPITKHTLEIMLSNPFYCGIIEIQKTGETYQGCHEPIVSLELFQQVQKVRANRQFKKATKHTHLFRGLFKCLQCKNSMIAERQKGHVYYRCHTRGCVGKTVREEKIDSALADALCELSIPNKMLAVISEKVMFWHDQAVGNQNADNLSMRLQNVDDRIEKLEDAVIEKIIDRDAYNKRKKKLVIERTEIIAEQDKEQARQNFPELIAPFLELVKSLVDYYIIGIDTEKREIAKLVFSNRFVFAGNVVVEPSNWLEATQLALSGLAGEPHRTRNRTIHEQKHIETLIEMASSLEVQRLAQEFVDGYAKAGNIKSDVSRKARNEDGRFVHKHNGI